MKGKHRHRGEKRREKNREKKNINQKDKQGN